MNRFTRVSPNLEMLNVADSAKRLGSSLPEGLVGALAEPVPVS